MSDLNLLPHAHADRFFPDQKVCEHCGAIYRRPRNVSRSAWSARRFCTVKCGATVHAERANTIAAFEEQIVPEPMSGCWLWTGTLHRDGYGQIRIAGITERAHRLSYQLHCGEVPTGLGVLHHCDVRCCVNPAHLYAGTTQENNADRTRRDRLPRGEANASSRLTAEAVRQIRRSSETHTDLAARFGVSRVTVANVRSGKVWGHVQ